MSTGPQQWDSQEYWFSLYGVATAVCWTLLSTMHIPVFVPSVEAKNLFYFNVGNSRCFYEVLMTRCFSETFIPNCDHQGYYRRVQCHRSIGVCWCVDKHGAEVRNSHKRGFTSCSKWLMKIVMLMLKCLGSSYLCILTTFPHFKFFIGFGALICHLSSW